MDVRLVRAGGEGLVGFAAGATGAAIDKIDEAEAFEDLMRFLAPEPDED